MKIMKLTSMKSFVFLSGLKHTHKSDVRGPSPRKSFPCEQSGLDDGYRWVQEASSFLARPSGYPGVKVLSCWCRRQAKQRTWGHNDNLFNQFKECNLLTKNRKNHYQFECGIFNSPDSYFYLRLCATGTQVSLSPLADGWGSKTEKPKTLPRYIDLSFQKQTQM